MSQVTVTRHIEAPVQKVFQTVSNIEGFSKAVPHIVEVEFLSETRSGVGARFRETRMMGGRKASTVLEVTEYVENERVRLVSDAGGTIWDSVFSVEREGGGTILKLTMDAKPYKFLQKFLVPLMMKGFMTKALSADMDAVKEYCET
ncbi:MAG: SRPBCC family protein [Gemmatimonadetes bacterium]|nr:SRPBCC family protein [Gemmatimonadota bacterium]NNM04582.1 SRPBCC family protein [Gemmatimonadota bacterium]